MNPSGFITMIFSYAFRPPFVLATLQDLSCWAGGRSGGQGCYGDPAAAMPSAFARLDVAASVSLVLFTVSTLLPFPVW